MYYWKIYLILKRSVSTELGKTGCPDKFQMGSYNSLNRFLIVS